MGRVVYFHFSMIWVLFFQFSITHIQNNIGIDIYFLLKLMIKIMCNGCVFFSYILDAAEKHLEKHVQGCGGRRTEPGFTNSTCTDEMVALGETRAKLWWEENRARIHKQYL
jgi:hypothetical protein